MPGILLFTDEPITATGLAAVLTSAPDFRVISVCDSIVALARRAQEHQPDVIVIDVTPEVTFEALTQIQHGAPRSRIILWTREISIELVQQTIHVGVRGVLLKTLPVELLIKCIARVNAGELWFDKRLTESLLTVKMAKLTNREVRLVQLLAQGLKNKEIAYALSLTEGTVKVYFSRLFKKVGVKDRFELALYGLRRYHNRADAAPGPDVLRGAADQGFCRGANGHQGGWTKFVPPLVSGDGVDVNSETAASW